MPRSPHLLQARGTRVFAGGWGWAQVFTNTLWEVVIHRQGLFRSQRETPVQEPRSQPLFPFLRPPLLQRVYCEPRDIVGEVPDIVMRDSL